MNLQVMLLMTMTMGLKSIPGTYTGLFGVLWNLWNQEMSILQAFEAHPVLPQLLVARKSERTVKGLGAHSLGCYSRAL